MKVLTEERIVELTEDLLANDKKIQDELKKSIESIENFNNELKIAPIEKIGEYEEQAEFISGQSIDECTIHFKKNNQSVPGTKKSGYCYKILNDIDIKIALNGSTDIAKIYRVRKGGFLFIDGGAYADSYSLKTNDWEIELSSPDITNKYSLAITSEKYYLTTENEIEYTPTEDYHPTPKKYVDEKIKKSISFLNEIGTGSGMQGDFYSINMYDLFGEDEIELNLLFTPAQIYTGNITSNIRIYKGTDELNGRWQAAIPETCELIDTLPSGAGVEHIDKDYVISFDSTNKYLQIYFGNYPISYSCVVSERRYINKNYVDDNISTVTDELIKINDNIDTVTDSINKVQETLLPTTEVGTLSGSKGSYESVNMYELYNSKEINVNLEIIPPESSGGQIMVYKSKGDNQNRLIVERVSVSPNSLTNKNYKMSFNEDYPYLELCFAGSNEMICNISVNDYLTIEELNKLVVKVNNIEDIQNKILANISSDTEVATVSGLQGQIRSVNMYDLFGDKEINIVINGTPQTNSPAQMDIPIYLYKGVSNVDGIANDSEQVLIETVSIPTNGRLSREYSLSFDDTYKYLQIRFNSTYAGTCVVSERQYITKDYINEQIQKAIDEALNP